MCRFIAYHGDPILVGDILFNTENSLIKQSISARESDITLNGDGFGLGWYNQQVDNEPALFRSIQPAWNDRNLAYLANKLTTDTFFAHIRAANMGGVGPFNCHPFHYKHFLFMHNGLISDFEKIKRVVRRSLSDNVYDWIKGQTDSEHIAALLFDKISLDASVEDIVAAFLQVANFITGLKAKINIQSSSVINTAISNGKQLVATRFYHGEIDESPTLYYTKDIEAVLPKGAKATGNGVLVASEKLNKQHNIWTEIPINHYLVINEDLSESLIPF